ncbi:hypothetical protein JCM16303_005801 [Sporobolomyces ruberrimus]
MWYFNKRMDNWEWICSHPVIKETIQATLIENPTPTKQAPPLRPEHLSELFGLAFSPNASYNNLLALAIAVPGFGGLMRPGELVAASIWQDRDPRKVVKRKSVLVQSGQAFLFHLPYHKADPFYERSNIVIVSAMPASDFNFVRALHAYL